MYFGIINQKNTPSYHKQWLVAEHRHTIGNNVRFSRDQRTAQKAILLAPYFAALRNTVTVL